MINPFRDSDAALSSGNEHYSSSRYQEALEAYEEAIRICLNRVEPTGNANELLANAYDRRADALRALGRHEAADYSQEFSRTLRPVTDYRPIAEKALDALNLGDRYFTSNDHKKALGTYAQAITLFKTVGQHQEYNPFCAAAYHHQAHAFINLSKYKEAIDGYERAIALNLDVNKRSEAYYNKGLALNNLSRHEEALDSYNEAIRVNLHFAGAYVNKGSVLAKLARHDEALEAYDRAIELQPNLTEAYYNKGVTLDNLSRHEDAIRAYDEAISRNSRYAAAYYNKGNSLGGLGRHRDAIAAYDQAIRLQPDLKQAYYNKGLALNNLSEHDDAIRAYNASIRLDDNFIIAYLNKAKTLQIIQNIFWTETRHSEILNCLNKVCQISQDQSLLDSNNLSQHDNNVMLYMLAERRNLLTNFIDLSQKVNKLKEDGIDTSTIDANFTEINTEVIAVTEASERIISQQEIQRDLGLLNQKIELIGLECSKLRQEYEQKKEEQEHKIESLEAAQIDTRKIVDEDRARIDVIEQDLEYLEQTLHSEFEKLENDIKDKRDDQRAKLMGRFGEFRLDNDKTQKKILDYFDSFVSSLETDFLVSKLVLNETFTTRNGGWFLDTVSAVSSEVPGGALVNTVVGKWNDFVKSADLKKAATKINHLAATIPEICDFAGTVAIRIIGDKTYRHKILNLEDEGQLRDGQSREEKPKLFKKILGFIEKIQEEAKEGLYGKQYKSIHAELGAIDASKVIETYLTELKIPKQERQKIDLANIFFTHITTQESAENNTSSNNNHTSAMAQVNLESLNQNDPNKKPTVNSKTCVISKITYNNPLLNFLAKEENEEIQNQIINKHGSRGLSKLIDIFEPNETTQYLRDMLDQSVSPTDTFRFLTSILGAETQESSELDQG
ncbi:MAG: tetratricopeptide repeat protein [Rickettsiaceae bacterium]|nr:tetratricopeptide repeat protein [Rickettsiaceae bacterium]